MSEKRPHCSLVRSCTEVFMLLLLSSVWSMMPNQILSCRNMWSEKWNMWSEKRVVIFEKQFFLTKSAVLQLLRKDQFSIAEKLHQFSSAENLCSCRVFPTLGSGPLSLGVDVRPNQSKKNLFLFSQQKKKRNLAFCLRLREGGREEGRRKAGRVLSLTRAPKGRSTYFVRRARMLQYMHYYHLTEYGPSAFAVPYVFCPIYFGHIVQPCLSHIRLLRYHLLERFFWPRLVDLHGQKEVSRRQPTHLPELKIPSAWEIECW